MTEVAIIEDEADTRNALASLVNDNGGFRCRQRYGSMEEALARIGAMLPQIVLVDLGLPAMSGIEGIRKLKERYPSLILVVLTIYEDDDRIFDALCAGASGYLLKTTPPSRLLECLAEAAAGGAPMSPQIAARVIRLFRDFRAPAPGGHDLTPHEVRILRLFVEGHNYKSAASLLKVSVATVAFHVQNIYGKLHVHSKAEAVSKALRDRIVF